MMQDAPSMLDRANNNLKRLTIFCLLPIFLSACGGSNSASDTNNKELTGKLLPPAHDEIYFGAFTDFGTLEDEVTTEKIENFDSLAGKPIAWSYFSNNWTTLNENNEHSPEIRYPKETIQEIHNVGKTPFVRLLPWVSPHQVTSSPKSRQEKAEDVIAVCKNSSKYSHNESALIATSELQEYIDNGASEGLCFNDFSMQSIIDGDWDDNLKQWAWDSLENQDDEGNPIPLLVTFTIEMNGFWFPWSGIYNGGAVTTEYGDPNLADGPERYRDAYRHIIDLFREEGADHITWFFSPDVVYPTTKWIPWMASEWNKPQNYYPGDDYIDWIGFTMYGGRMVIDKGSPIPNDIEYFSTEISKKYHMIQAISENKPYALLETSTLDYQDGRKSIWLTDMFETILNNPDYSNIKALSFWNDYFEDDDELINHNIDSSEDSLFTFRELINNPRFISELRFSE